MSKKVVKLKKPFDWCNANIIYTVAKPSISEASSGMSTNVNNFPEYSNSGPTNMFVLNGSLYNLYSIGGGAAGYVLRKLDSSNSTWENAITIPNIPIYDAMVTATNLGVNDKIYFYGGRLLTDSTYQNTLYCYDVTTNTTTTIGSGGPVRVFGSCAISEDGTRFFAFSGTSGSGYLSSFIECVVGSNTWISRATTPAPRMKGSLVPFNGDLYLYGAEYCDNSTDGKKLWKYNLTSNVWEFIVDTNSNADMQGFLFKDNSNLYLNSIRSQYDFNSNYIYKYDVINKTCTEVMGQNTYQFSTEVHLSQMYATVYYNNQIWSGSYNSNTLNNKPTGYLCGTLDLVNHSNNLIFYEKGLLTLSMTSSLIKTNPLNDTPEKLRIQFYNSYSADIGIAEYSFTTGQTVNATNYSYLLVAPDTIVDVSEIYSIKLAYKSINADWSPWSDVMSLYGGS